MERSSRIPVAADLPPSAPPPLAEGRLRLVDRRLLAWAEFGAADGIPLLYCHGTPGSRLEARLGEAAARQLGLRLIAPDRSGYGYSDSCAGRTLIRASDDLRQLCDHLGLQQLLLLGVSGGGPFACAAAAGLGGRVAALGLICPVGPLTGVPPNRLPLFPWRLLLHWGLWPGHPLERALVPALFLLARTPRWFLRWEARYVAESDRRILTDPGASALLQDSMISALQAGNRGIRDDLTAFRNRWGFPLASIQCPVLLWHGLEDRVVPPLFGELLARRLPHCLANYPPDEGHFSLPIGHSLELLAALLDRAQAARGPWYTGSGSKIASPEKEFPMEKRIATFLESSAFGVVGASSNREKYGNKVLRCYQQQGRRAIPVNPREENIEGLDCVSRVADLPPEVKSLSIITPPPVTEQVVEEAIAHGIRNIWMQPGAESPTAVAACKEKGINLIADGSCVLVVLGFHGP